MVLNQGAFPDVGMTRRVVVEEILRRSAREVAREVCELRNLFSVGGCGRGEDYFWLQSTADVFRRTVFEITHNRGSGKPVEKVDAEQRLGHHDDSDGQLHFRES